MQRTIFNATRRLSLWTHFSIAFSALHARLNERAQALGQSIAQINLIHDVLVACTHDITSYFLEYLRYALLVLMVHAMVCSFILIMHL